MNKFYVYEHWRPDEDICFYVGKGHGKRSSDFKKRRNGHYRAIVTELAIQGMCVEVRLVASGLSEPDAFSIEIERIAFWRSTGIVLANKTDGGEGLSNPSVEVRAVLAAAARVTHKGRKHSSEQTANRTASIRTTMATVEFKEKRSAASIKMWVEHRETILIGLRSQKPSAARSASQIGNTKSLGKNRTQKTKLAMSIAQKKRYQDNPLSEEIRANMSAGQKRRFAKQRAKYEEDS